MLSPSALSAQRPSLSPQPPRTFAAASEEAAIADAVKAINTQDDFFRNDFGIRGVNKAWLAMMRKKIPGRDIWISGQQLVDEGSGIVDRLAGAPVR